MDFSLDTTEKWCYGLQKGDEKFSNDTFEVLLKLVPDTAPAGALFM